MKRLTDTFFYSLPLVFFLILFFFYGYGEISYPMFTKITGLLALALVGCAFIIGPLSYFTSGLFDQFKKYRKFLGVSGVLVALAHILLSFGSYFKFNLGFMLAARENPHLLGVYFGLAGVVILSVLAITSRDRIMKALGGKNWKILQTTGYAGLAFVMMHFIFMETNKGVFLIRRPLGRVIFVFGFLVLLVRLLVYMLNRPKK